MVVRPRTARDSRLREDGHQHLSRLCEDGHQHLTTTLFRRIFASSQQLGEKDIPFDGLSNKQIVHILIGDTKGIEEQALRRMLREEMRRWHPDKFSQKIGGRIKKDDFNIIMERVKKVSQALNTYKVCEN